LKGMGNQSQEKYSNQILELQMKVEELTKTKESLKARLTRAEEYLEQKENLLSVTSSQLSSGMSDLQAKLSKRITENEALKAELDDLTAKLDDNPVANKLQSKLNAESKERRALETKIGDIDAELKRKEKQITDIVDRYTQEIADLESKLEEEKKSQRKAYGPPSAELAEARIARDQLERALSAQKRTNADLQKELDALKLSARSVNSVNKPAADDKIRELEAANERLEKEWERLTAEADSNKERFEKELAKAKRDNAGPGQERHELEDRLQEVEKAKAELEERLKKVNGERTEVITALEEVINEVQSREDEIDSLAQILRRRDEELDHAKMIATKALASAQELKARYKGKGGDRSAELLEKIQELNTNIDFLSKKNDSLERKTSRMERELKDKEKEVAELRSSLHERGLSKGEDKLDKFLDSNKDRDSFHPLTDDGFPAFGSCTSSPTQAGTSLLMNDTMSTQSAELHGGSGWLHDFDSHSVYSSDDAASFAGARTEPSESKSRRSIERDALRKYVRKRYMKSKT